MKVKCYVCQKDMDDTEAARAFYDPENKRHYLCKDCAESVTAGEMPIQQTTENVQETQESEEASSTGWITLIRTIMWLVIIVGFLASIVCGCLIGEESGWLGFLVIIVGILLTLILAAATMIYLDMADDVHAIRQKLDKK